MPTIQLSAEVLAGFAGAIISIIFSYFPRLKDAFAALSTELKSGIMLGLLALTTAVITALDWFNVIDAGLTFDGQWVARVVFIFISAVIANQAAYKVSPQTKSVKIAKLERDYNDQAELLA